MQATTIKITGEVLDRLRAAKPKSQNLAGFVRELLQCELQRRVLRQAATDYAAFLEATPAEESELGLWEASDLASPPKKRTP